jgi:hypothetical protein
MRVGDNNSKLFLTFDNMGMILCVVCNTFYPVFPELNKKFVIRDSIL